MTLDGALDENPAPSFRLTFSGTDAPSFPAIIRAIDRAVKRSDIKTVFVRVGSLGVGWARAQELHSAITRLKASGKKVTALLEDCGNMEYYVATAADEIRALPESIIEVHGLSGEVMFLKGAFDKLGVEAQFVAMGKYKNAPNQYTEKAMTASHREQMTALIGGLYQEYVKAVAASRKKTEAEAEALLSAGPYDGDSALAAGLVDKLDYPEEALSDAGPSRHSLSEFKDAGGALDTRAKIALIFVDGDIMPGESQQPGLGSSGVAGSDTIAQALRDAREDASIKAVILRVNSPGGSGSASDVIAREVELTDADKPVIASMADYAASGGYYVSAPARKIVASPTTITGSIGVFFGKFVLKGLFDKVGITNDFVDQGEGGSFASAARPWSPQDVAKVQRLASGFYDRFVALVAEHRGMEVADVHEIAQGRVWTGGQAKEVGLVDEIGGFEKAVALAKQEAKISETSDVAVVIMPKQQSPFERLLDEADGWGNLKVRARQARALPRSPEEVVMSMRERLTTQSNTLWARLPYSVEIR